MTPLQKANELFDKYMAFDFNTIVNSTQREYAKECALIAVKEIMESKPKEPMSWNNVDAYWKEVTILLESF